MKHYAISIYDTKAMAFTPPAFFPARGLAIRSFIDAITEGKGNLGKHPEDFLLHELGTFDDQDGSFDQVAKPTILASGNDYIARPGALAAVKEN